MPTEISSRFSDIRCIACSRVFIISRFANMTLDLKPITFPAYPTARDAIAAGERFARENPISSQVQDFIGSDLVKFDLFDSAVRLHFSGGKSLWIVASKQGSLPTIEFAAPSSFPFARVLPSVVTCRSGQACYEWDREKDLKEGVGKRLKRISNYEIGLCVYFDNYLLVFQSSEELSSSKPILEWFESD